MDHPKEQTIEVDGLDYKVSYAYGHRDNIMPPAWHSVIPSHLEHAPKIWCAFCYVVHKHAIIAVGATKPEMDANVREGIRTFWVEKTRELTEG